MVVSCIGVSGCLPCSFPSLLSPDARPSRALDTEAFLSAPAADVTADDQRRSPLGAVNVEAQPTCVHVRGCEKMYRGCGV